MLSKLEQENGTIETYIDVRSGYWRADKERSEDEIEDERGRSEWCDILCSQVSQSECAAD